MWCVSDFRAGLIMTSTSEQMAIAEQKELIERLLNEKSIDRNNSSPPTDIDQPVESSRDISCQSSTMATSFDTENPSRRCNEIEDYHILIRKLLSENNARRHQLENSHYVMMGSENVLPSQARPTDEICTVDPRLLSTGSSYSGSRSSLAKGVDVQVPKERSHPRDYLFPP